MEPQTSHMTGAAVNDASKNMASDAWHDPPVHWWVGENKSKCQKGQSGQRVLNGFFRKVVNNLETSLRLKHLHVFRSPFWIFFWPRGP